MKLSWSDSTGLLKASNGHTWRYTDFERYLTHAITPSMYHFMAGYVKHHINPETFVNGTYFSDGIEARAIDAYYDLSLKDRKEMHEQELVNLRSESNRIRKKLDAITEAKLSFMYEYPDFFPITDDVVPHLTKLGKEYTKLYDRLISDEYVEDQWNNLRG